MAVRNYSWESVVRGHHIYKDICTPVISESLQCEQERSNPKDCDAVSVMKDGTIVGNVLCEKS